MRVSFTEPAEEDLEAIGDWIVRDNPDRAITFVRELRRSCLQIGSRPRSYPFVEHRLNDGIRRRVHGNYLIFYRVTDTVEILRILHGARDYGRILFGDDDLD
ncbi:MAG: type II toxin-antitoxin system RelE/ParE family toxin [Alphaproteobacteria bacterium]|nr:type II toxin-antitoxin system RelE/ParE family toxin [Alphaproteobacteria bacterium]